VRYARVQALFADAYNNFWDAPDFHITNVMYMHAELKGRIGHVSRRGPVQRPTFTYDNEGFLLYCIGMIGTRRTVPGFLNGKRISLATLTALTAGTPVDGAALPTAPMAPPLLASMHAQYYAIITLLAVLTLVAVAVMVAVRASYRTTWCGPGGVPTMVAIPLSMSE
jgi:hypothetical protein